MNFHLIKQFQLLSLFLLTLMTSCLSLDRSVNITNSSGNSSTSLSSNTTSAGSTSSKTLASVQLSWGAASFGQDGFKIEQSLDGTQFTQIQTLDKSTTSYLVTGLARSKTYYFRIRSYNAFVTSGPSTVIQASTPN